jgi:hypothetical protein
MLIAKEKPIKLTNLELSIITATIIADIIILLYPLS